jgi:ribosomal protein L31
MPATMMACSSRVTAFRGARVGGPSKGVSAGGATGAVMMKKDIHPEWHAEAPVICNGVEVMRVGGTKPQYNVDIYSGNHPFYNGVRTMMVMDDGQLNKCVPGPDSHGSMRPVDL